MREGWEVKTLGEVVKLEYGKPLSKEDRDPDGAYPAYGANGIKCRTNLFYHDKPSMIVGRKGSAGEVTLTGGAFWPLDVTFYVTFDDTQYDRMFIFHCLKSLALTKLAKGVKPGINRNDVYGIEFTFPPLAEQKRIVAVLDEAFAGIKATAEAARKNLISARELFDTTLNATFTQKGEGWVETTLGEVCENLDRQRVPITKSKRVSGDIPYYGASGVVDFVAEYIFDEDLLLVSEDGANLLARTYPIAFGISGKTWVNNHAHALRFTEIDSQKFVEYYLNSISLEPFVSGMAQPKLNQKMLNSIPIPWPSLEIQQQIVERVKLTATQTQALEALYQRKLDALDELKQSLLQKAFAGELTASRANKSELQTTSSEFGANVIALHFHQHEKANQQKTYGRVKAQKGLHLVESIGGIDMGRVPIKDAAGPNDSAHSRSAENWAKAKQFFEFVKRSNGLGYDFVKLPKFDELLTKAENVLAAHRNKIDQAIAPLVHKRTRAAEIFTTVHTAWNNLIIDGDTITEDAIVTEARENWHPDKQDIDRHKFIGAIHDIRHRGLEPKGIGKRVGVKQERLI